MKANKEWRIMNIPEDTTDLKDFFAEIESENPVKIELPPMAMYHLMRILKDMAWHSTYRIKMTADAETRDFLIHTIGEIGFVLNYILKSQYYQELYDNHSWNFSEQTRDLHKDTEKVVEGSEDDYYSRFLCLSIIIECMVHLKASGLNPPELMRFIERYESMHDESHWQRIDQFWKEYIEKMRQK